MASRNDVTGDTIQTKSASKAYQDNYDRIFGKKKSTKPIPIATDERIVSGYLKEALVLIKQEAPDWALVSNKIEKALTHINEEIL